MRAALPALDESEVAGWVVRASGGTTKRVNSANPTRPGARLADVLAVAEAAYAERGLPPRFRLTPLAADGTDAALAAAGYAAVDPSWTMIAPTAGHAVDPAVMIAAGADAAFIATLAATLDWSAEQADVHAAILARAAGRLAVASTRMADRPVAFGIASIACERSCLFDIVVAPSWRGHGIGRRVIQTLLGWSAMHGAGTAVLQVLADNAPARALYASLGFSDAYRYHYRIRR